MMRPDRGRAVRANRFAIGFLAVVAIIGSFGFYRWATDRPVRDPNYLPCPDLDWGALEARGGSTGPLPKTMPTDWLRTHPIAHRGLHDESRGIVENSLSASRAAAEAGYPMELDVQLSRDGEAMVIHDPDLGRLTGTEGRVCDFTAEELGKLHLKGTGDTLPTLQQVFDVVRGRVPILIETKQLDYPVGPLEERVARLIAAYGGPVAIHSFSAESLGWFADHLPAVPRGQIAFDYAHAGTSLEYTVHGEVMLSGLHKWELTNLMRSGVSRPDFVSYDLEDLPRLAVSLASALGLPILVWTIDKPAEAERAKGLADNLIFETIRPPLPDPR